jgi:hypothetical protein
MFGNDSRESGELNLRHMEDSALNGMEVVCSVISQPVEIMLRPWYGTRYFPVPVTALAAALMIFLPLIISMLAWVGHLIPFVNIPPPRGMVDFATFEELYFAFSAFHAYRLWQRMIHMERESHSQYEGAALPIFSLIPWFGTFWKTRILAEPLFVFLAAIVLRDFLIIQSPLAFYFQIAALALMGKNFVAWFRNWQFVRIRLDIRNAAPTIARLIDDQATEEELNQIHLASFPKNIDPEIRKATAIHIARTFNE